MRSDCMPPRGQINVPPEKEKLSERIGRKWYVRNLQNAYVTRLWDALLANKLIHLVPTIAATALPSFYVLLSTSRLALFLAGSLVCAHRCRWATAEKQFHFDYNYY